MSGRAHETYAEDEDMPRVNGIGTIDWRSNLRSKEWQSVLIAIGFGDLNDSYVGAICSLDELGQKIAITKDGLKGDIFKKGVQHHLTKDLSVTGEGTQARLIFVPEKGVDLGDTQEEFVRILPDGRCTYELTFIDDGPRLQAKGVPAGQINGISSLPRQFFSALYQIARKTGWVVDCYTSGFHQLVNLTIYMKEPVQDRDQFINFFVSRIGKICQAN